MSTPTITAQPALALPRGEAEVDRYEAVRQCSLSQILAIWAAAAVPMAVLAWLVAPALA